MTDTTHESSGCNLCGAGEWNNYQHIPGCTNGVLPGLEGAIEARVLSESTNGHQPQEEQPLALDPTRYLMPWHVAFAELAEMAVPVPEEWMQNLTVHAALAYMFLVSQQVLEIVAGAGTLLTEEDVEGSDVFDQVNNSAIHAMVSACYACVYSGMLSDKVLAELTELQE
jgi:hypothetical protein